MYTYGNTTLNNLSLIQCQRTCASYTHIDIDIAKSWSV